MRFATIATTALTALTVLAGSAWAETDYRDFYDLNEDEQGAIISEVATTLVEEANASGEDVRAQCITALYFSSAFNPFEGQYPVGWETLFKVIEYERSAMATYDHYRTAEQTIAEIADVFCPPEN